MNRLGLDRNMAIVLLFSFVALLTFVEMFYSYFKDRKYYNKKDTWTNVYLTTCAAVVNLACKAATFFILDYFYQFRFMQISSLFWYWFILVLVQDFLYWALHTLGHYVRLFWAMHVTHHSSEYFNLTTGFRATVFEPLYRMFFYIPLALLGFSAVDILFCYMATQIYGNIVHTRTVGRLHPIIEYIFVTPSHHRVHHASNLRYLDKNMGMILIIWDRMFGTFQREDDTDPVIYGLTKPLEDKGPVNIIFHEFGALGKDIRKASRWKDKLKYLLNPPGWSHDGSSQTARVMQKELKEKI